MSDKIAEDAEQPHRMVNGVKVLLSKEEIEALAKEEAARPPRIVRWEVPQLVVVRRLIAAGKLRDALAALQLDAAAGKLTDAELALRESWRAASAINNDDPDALALLAAIGADPAVILARP